MIDMKTFFTAVALMASLMLGSVTASADMFYVDGAWVYVDQSGDTNTSPAGSGSKGDRPDRPDSGDEGDDDGNNGHGDEDDHDDDSNPGKGKRGGHGKGGKPGNPGKGHDK